MTRQVKVEFSEDVLERLKGEEPVEIEAEDGEGNRWAVWMQRDVDRKVVTLSLEPLAPWNVRMEGFAIGSAHGSDPAEAAREALRAAEITSLPEAVLVQAERAGESWAVFTLDGQAYCVPQNQFNTQIAPGGQWTNARSKQSRNIETLKAELKKIGR